MDESEWMVFEELGLSRNEAKVYSALISFGTMSAGEVCAKSGVSYSRIYNVLDALISKALVQVVPEKTKKFSATDPESFTKLIEEKEKILGLAKNKIKELRQFYHVKEKNPVVLAVGKKGFYEVVSLLMEPKKFEYNVKWTSEYLPRWAEKRKKRVKNGVDVKDLVRYDKETKENIDQWLKISNKIKEFDNEGVAMSIKDGEQVMIGLIKSNVTLLIRDKPFAKIMKKMFEATYDNADKIGN